MLLNSWLCYHVKGLRNVRNSDFASLPICHAVGLVDSGKLKLLNCIGGTKCLAPRIMGS